MIIVEAAAVNAHKRPIKRMLGIYDDSFIPGLRRLVDIIHAEGVKVAQQIVDALIAMDKVPADLTLVEIKGIIDDFVAAAVRVREAGFDAVEFHMAHMYTLADFLSKKTNTRQDEYGRDIEGRIKIVEEILGKTRERLGSDYPILCRINGDEFMVGGNTLLHAKIIARRLEELGVDAIDVSAGGRPGPEGPRSYNSFRTVPNQDWPDGVNAYLAEEIKRVVHLPVITAGKISNPQIAEQILQEKKADIIALGRPLFCDPDFAKKARSGKFQEIIRCRYCNRCMVLVWKGEPVVCVQQWRNRSSLSHESDT